MPRNGTATKAAEPNELYDGLNQASQDTWDWIGAMGYRPDQNDKGWVALATKGDDIIGPFENLSLLAAEVQKKTNSPEPAVAENAASDEGEKEAIVTEGEETELPSRKLHKIAADSRGNRYLPGTEPIVDEEIMAAAGKYHAIKTDRCNLTSKEVAAKDELANICHRKSHLFKADPENSNTKIYKVGDLVIRIANEVKEKITTEVVGVD